MENHLPIELWQEIMEQSNTIEQIQLTMVCKYFQNNLQVTDLYNCPEKYLKILSDKELDRYPYVKKLNACNNRKITKVNHMTNLRKLDARGECGIDDKGLEGLNLYKLNAHNNKKITKII